MGWFPPVAVVTAVVRLVAAVVALWVLLRTLVVVAVVEALDIAPQRLLKIKKLKQKNCSSSCSYTLVEVLLYNCLYILSDLWYY